MLNLVALPGQQLIKRRIDKRADLKDGRRMVVGIDSLAVMDFLTIGSSDVLTRVTLLVRCV